MDMETHLICQANKTFFESELARLGAKEPGRLGCQQSEKHLR